MASRTEQARIDYWQRGLHGTDPHEEFGGGATYRLADQIVMVLEQQKGTGMSPSQVARKIRGAVTEDVRNTLWWLVANQLAKADSRDLNARTHYFAW